MSKQYFDGTHRAVAPTVTLERLRPLLRDLGITRVANITGLDWIGIPVVTVTRPASRSLVVSQGKGVTLDGAKASALMESIEMLHAERPELPLRFASLNDLEGLQEAIVDLAKMPKVDEQPMDRNRPLLWAQGYDLMSSRFLWVPYASITIDDTFTGMASVSCLPSNSNGLASGNCKEEAVLHALCELVERDASTIWHLGSDAGRDRTRIDLTSVDDPVCRHLLELYNRAQIEVFAFEITTDICIPAFEVFIREKGTNTLRDQFCAVGSGCHLWTGIALSRALTEAAQCRLTLISGAREDLDRGHYNLDDGKRSVMEQYLSAAAGESRKFRSSPYNDPPQTETFGQNIQRVVDALQSVGIHQAVTVDLTSPRYDIPVVRAIVPGLEGVFHEDGYVPNDRVRRVSRPSRVTS